MDPMSVNVTAFGCVRTGGGDGQPELGEGPVAVLVRYSVDDSDSDAFVGAMAEVGRLRRRDGAMQWQLYRDIDSPGEYVELFTVATWAEHLRQIERPTASDLESWTGVRPLYRDAHVQHFVAASAWRAARKRTRQGPPGTPPDASSIQAAASLARGPELARSMPPHGWAQLFC